MVPTRRIRLAISSRVFCDLSEPRIDTSADSCLFPSTYWQKDIRRVSSNYLVTVTMISEFIFPMERLLAISRASSECPMWLNTSVASVPAFSLSAASPPGCYRRHNKIDKAYADTCAQHNWQDARKLVHGRVLFTWDRNEETLTTFPPTTIHMSSSETCRETSSSVSTTIPPIREKRAQRANLPNNQTPFITKSENS